jgi:hypothetical protein
MIFTLQSSAVTSLNIINLAVVTDRDPFVRPSDDGL